MQITSSYYRCRHYYQALRLGVGSGMAHMIEHSELMTEPFCKRAAVNVKPLRPSRRTLRKMAHHYKNQSRKHSV